MGVAPYFVIRGSESQTPDLIFITKSLLDAES